MFNTYLTEGVDELARWQQKDGSFLSFSSVDPEHFTSPQILHAIFSTALILSAMNSMTETPVLKRMKKKAAAFLLSQKSDDWSFNYWVRTSEEAKKMPYPDDLDDTFCALAALYEYDSKLFDGAAFAKIIRLLTTTEVKEGGPYRTWLVTKNVPDVWKDVDIAVNSNVAHFLTLQDIELPHITTFIEKAIKTNTVFSPYYNGAIPIIYFISRWYKGSLTNELIAHLVDLQQQKNIIDTPLLNAFIILSLLNFNAPITSVSAGITSLLKKQNAWEAYGFYIDLVMQGKKHYAGSRALTAAFCLLAGNAYMLATEKTTRTSTETISGTDVYSKNIDAAVISTVTQRFVAIDKKVACDAKKIIDDMLLVDVAKQITLLPYLISSSIRPTHKKIPESFLISLGCASLYGWLAYTLYDDFLDDEGDPKTIPIANVSLRELTLLFMSVMSEHGEFLALFKKTMDATDKANMWELTHCRFKVTKTVFQFASIDIPEYGNYKYLADRSMGHALAGTAVLFSLGYKEDSPEVKLLLKFFYHYIIARQLDDDAHDFVEDLKKGHINAVGALVLKSLQQTYKADTPLAFSQVVRLAHDVFWREIVTNVSHAILRHVAKARKAIEDNVLIEKKEVFLSILSSVEFSAERALKEHANVMGFLEVYR